MTPPIPGSSPVEGGPALHLVSSDSDEPVPTSDTSQTPVPVSVPLDSHDVEVVEGGRSFVLVDGQVNPEALAALEG